MLRTGTYSEETGRQLFGVAAQLSHLAAWTAYDMDDGRRAELYFSKALELASAAGDNAFAAEILAARSHRAIHLGIPDRAIELARASRHVAARTGVSVLLAEAHELEANGHALLGEGRACAASLHECERAFDRAASAAVPVWLAYFDRAYLAARFAHTLRDLGDWGEAERHALDASAMSRSLARARARAFNTALLATAYVETELDRALAVGMEALGMAGGLQSGRVVRYVADLRRRLRKRYGNDPKIREFDRQASEMLGSR
jgi:tetratricopeptide (TPR) repeat protein